MDAGCHAGQSGHGLALASCGDQHGGLRRIVFSWSMSMSVPSGILIYPSSLAISMIVTMLRPSTTTFFAIFISRIYYLLHTVYIGSKGSHDNAVIRMLCENRIKVFPTLRSDMVKPGRVALVLSAIMQGRPSFPALQSAAGRWDRRIQVYNQS